MAMYEDEDELAEAEADIEAADEVGEEAEDEALAPAGRPILEDMASGLEQFRPGELTIEQLLGMMGPEEGDGVFSSEGAAAGFGDTGAGGGMDMGMDAMAGQLPVPQSQPELPGPTDRDVLPLDNPEVKQALAEILNERAKERQRASEFFQEQARMMTRKTFGFE